MQRYLGQIVIVGIVLLAVTLGGFAWWHHYHQGDQILHFWGTDTIRLVNGAPQVEFWRLAAPPADGADRDNTRLLMIDRQPRWIVQRIDLSQAKGLLHARHALLEDASYDWTAEARDCQPEWDFALRFTDGDRQATLAFDRACRKARWLEQDREVAMTKTIDQLDAYLQRRAGPSASGNTSDPVGTGA